MIVVGNCYFFINSIRPIWPKRCLFSMVSSTADSRCVLLCSISSGLNCLPRLSTAIPIRHHENERGRIRWLTTPCCNERVLPSMTSRFHPIRWTFVRGRALRRADGGRCHIMHRRSICSKTVFQDDKHVTWYTMIFNGPSSPKHTITYIQGIYNNINKILK